MAQGGWIKLYRSLLNDPVWTQTNAEQKAVAIVILLSANREAKQWVFNGQKITLEPGQFVTSAQALSEAAGGELTRRKIRTALNKLEKLGFCSIQAANHGTLINVVKWAFYQGVPQTIGADATSKTANNSTSKTANRSEAESQGTQDVQLTVDEKAASSSTSKAAKESTTIKKYKKYKNNAHGQELTDSDLAEEFETVWKMYPRKKGKADSKKAYVKARKRGVSMETIQAAVVEFAKAQAGNSPMYIPYGSTWFNGAGWEDEDNGKTDQPHSEPRAPASPQDELHAYVIRQAKVYGGLSLEDAAARIVDSLSQTDTQLDPRQVLAIVQEYRKTGEADAARH